LSRRRRLTTAQRRAFYAEACGDKEYLNEMADALDSLAGGQ